MLGSSVRRVKAERLRRRRSARGRCGRGHDAPAPPLRPRGERLFWEIVKGPALRYADALVDAFESLLRTAPHKTGRSDATVVVDCAGGVGAFGVHQLRRRLEERGLASVLSLRAANMVREAPLNDCCGAEHVQKQRLPPKICLGETSACPTSGAARLTATPTVWCIGSMDGQISRSSTATRSRHSSPCSSRVNSRIAQPLIGTPSLGVVQTAYANGAAAAFLHSKGVEVAFAKTGVKYVHHAAEAFDVGVYFEANGHGTVLVRGLRERLAQLDREPGTGGRARLAVSRLHAVARLANQAVGDALADLLLVEAVLCLQQKSIAAWGALYDELPSRRQLKQRVASRALLEPNATETRLVAPAALQAQDRRARRIP